MTPSRALSDIIRARRPDQIAFLVADIEAAMPRWSDEESPDRSWRRYLYDQEFLVESSFRGEAGEFSMRLALMGSGPQVELIEPIDGPSIYHEWIDAHGYGFHHIGYFVDDLDEAVRDFTARGIPLVQSGSGYGVRGDGGFAYFDLEAELGVHVELIQPPIERRKPLVSFR